MYKKWIPIMGLACICLVGCDAKEAKEPQSDSKVENTVEQPANKEVSIPANEEAQKVLIVPSASEVKDFLTIGTSKEAIIELLGSDYEEVPNAKNGGIMWRYDVHPAKSYQYQLDSDAYDLDAIANKQVEYQLFISFSPDDTLSSYSLGYKLDEQTIEVFYKLEDGTTKSDLIPIEGDSPVSE